MAEPRSAKARLTLPVIGAPAPESGDVAAAGPSTSPDLESPHVRVGFVTLGCDKNTVDSERMLARVLGAGASLAERPEDADVVIVNTCGFIESAREESIEAILDAARLKKDGGVRAVVAAGCLVQRYRDELRAELPEVDLFLNLAEAERLVPELRERGLLPERAVPNMERPLRALSGRTRHTSYLKISEGCDHSCAFCAIPLMRGKFRSTPAEVLVAEAQELERGGVRELNVVSQDTTWYGRDFGRGRLPEPGEAFFMGRAFDGMRDVALPAAPALATLEAGRESAAQPTSLTGLLERLIAETSIPWLRLFYMYPSGVTRELVELMATEPRLLPYLDMPLQHGSDRILERMRRPERRSVIRERVAWLRDAVPELALRTTVIIGFPGETEDDFDELLDLLEEIRFDQVGAFAYSVEEGTRAAAMDGEVPASVVRERLERLEELQRAISLERNEARVGRTMRALVDRVEADGSAVGRTAAQALEVDGVTLIRGGAGLRVGEFVDVRIVDALDQDVVAEPA